MRRSSPLHNFLALALAHGSGYALGLVMIPFLLHIYPPAQYGQLVMAQTLAGFCMLLANYGSDFTAVQSIAEAPSSPEVYAKVSSLVLSFRFLAGIVLAGPFFVSCWAAGIPWDLAAAAYLGMLVGMGFPNWVFQGREQMQWPSRLQIVGQVLGLVLVLAWIRPGVPIRDVALLLAIPSLLQTGLAWRKLRREETPLAFRFPGWKALHAVLKENLPLVLGSASATAFCAGSVFWVGALAGPALAGLFGTAWKFFQVGATLLSHAQTAIYPRLARLRTEQPEQARDFFRKAVLALLGLALVLCLGTQTIVPWILPWVVGAAYTASLPALRVLALAFPLVALNTALTASLVQQKKRWDFAKVLGVSALVSLASTALFLHYGPNVLIPAWVYVGTETLEALLLLGLRRRSRLSRTSYAQAVCRHSNV